MAATDQFDHVTSAPYDDLLQTVKLRRGGDIEGKTYYVPDIDPYYQNGSNGCSIGEGEAETVYEDGETVRVETGAYQGASAKAVAAARAQAGLSQKELAERTGIDQSDISKIERGVANPSVATLERIAAALGGELSVSITVPVNE